MHLASRPCSAISRHYYSFSTDMRNHLVSSLQTLWHPSFSGLHILPSLHLLISWNSFDWKLCFDLHDEHIIKPRGCMAGWLTWRFWRNIVSWLCPWMGWCDWLSCSTVSSGEQLVHSRYLQQLCSLALLLRLDTVLCTQAAPCHVPHPEPGQSTRR